MITCPNCRNSITDDEETCHFCGSMIHKTTNFAFNKKKKKKQPPVTTIQRVLASAIDTFFITLPIAITALYLFLRGVDFTPLELIQRSGIFTLLILVIQAYFMVHDGQSAGKKVMKIAIVDFNSNEHPSPFRLIVLRTLVPLMPFILPLLGVILYSVNLFRGLKGDKRCFHDILAGTKVVHE